MSFSTLIRFFAAIMVLSALAVTLVVAKRAFSERDEKEAPASKVEAMLPAKQASDEAIAALVSKLEVENLPDVTPGERAFESARDLLEKGDFVAAEEKLKYVNTYYPTAVSAPEARRILGEMNMDRLFDGKEFAQFVEYEVKRGDSFFKIVRDHETHLDMLMFLNDMTRTDKLHPGDKFRLLALNYRLVVNIPRMTVSLWDGPRYIKGYEIRKSTLPSGSEIRKTKLIAKEAVYGEKRVSLPSSDFRRAEKVLVLKNPQVEIRPYREVDEGAVAALYLDASDVEELALLTRPSNSVEIRY
ncbi:LysM peptidoglycan-binding domain-containing protein [Rubritalea tangerina]|uniref:LysM peptidoglycan-binding domain-containing protein n=1 Tax=Rubritalea tangerina TaxID=430798 RepID=A0ABW4Z7H2_9BACT